MKIQIILNDVGDGDAIIFVLQREVETLVGVIDGGRAKDSDKVIIRLDELLKQHGKTAPDLIVGTHYDNDHIGGLFPLIQHYKDARVDLWMFNTTRVEVLLRPEFHEMAMFPGEEDLSIGGEYRASYEAGESELITSLQKEKDILALARTIGMRVTEPIAGKCDYPGWPEIQVLGPTQEYYDLLFPERLSLKDLVENMIRADQPADKPILPDPCAVFTAEKSKISRVNLLSAVIRIQVNDKGFLFTGDAGIDSFMAIPAFRTALDKIYWLKMPHHGSANNLNQQLLDLMRPAMVAVSGDRYIDDQLILCMRSKGIIVRTTKDEGDLGFAEETR